jgi:hypothetical protein
MNAIEDTHIEFGRTADPPQNFEPDCIPGDWKPANSSPIHRRKLLFLGTEKEGRYVGELRCWGGIHSDSSSLRDR